ncbi:alpha/beta fold hydrolase [Nonomuraea sp. NBC_01738]|uniref:thioesterase II family protein n=1 Tax=Nonomuraea sp. NBC_01738 TaxID=2976003 RepID=UPI002E0E8223|nr:alpha/beta fold hydrolase [Nonomuraea sp. NBC_01738]
MTVDTSLWVRRFHPVKEDAARLVCFPHAGGSASYYFPVSQALSPAVEVLAIQYPGRQDRRTEPLIDDVHTLAAQIADNLGPWTDRPFALFGHSMGATVAYEVARLLEERGHRPLHLFASGRRAPSRYRDENVHRLGDDGVIGEMKRLNGTDSQVLGDEELLRMVLGAVRNDYKAIETYRHKVGPKLECPVTALVGDDDPKTTVEEAESWSWHTNGPFELGVYRGGHFYLNSHKTELLRRITQQLTSVRKV